MRDRLKIQEEVTVHYRDELAGEYVPMLTDQDLDVGVSRNPKLQLYIGYAT